MEKITPIQTPEKIKNFLKETIKNLESKETTNEVELKFVYKNRDLTRDEIKAKYNELQDKILEKLEGKVIFDGKIKDDRYLDVPEKEKNDSYLRENGITVIRIREQKEKGKNKEFLYTIKRKDENGYSEEYEIPVDENYGNDLEQKGLQKIKTSEKTRKEIKFNVYLGEDKIKKEVKIAFDEYTDDRLGVLPPFFEIESDDEDAIKEAIKILELDESDFIITTGGPEKYLKYEGLFDNLEGLNDKRYILKIFKEVIEEIINYDSIFSEIGEFLNNENISKLDSKNYKKLEKYIKKVLEKFILKLIEEDENYFYFFSRLFNKKTINDFKETRNINIKFGKKFNDKFKREFPGYSKALIYSILNNINKNDNINTITSLKIIKDNINIFLKALFIFDDNLTKNELIKFLEKSEESITVKYDLFETRLLKTFKLVKKLNFGDDIDFLKTFVTIYKTGIRSIGHDKNNDLNKEGADIIKENIEKVIIDLLSQLSSNFSKWLDSNQTEEEKLKNYLGIKKLFKEVFFHIYLFKTNKIGFTELYSEKFNKDLVIDILEKYSYEIFNKSNFLNQEVEEKILRDFLGNLFDEENQDSNKIKEYGVELDKYYEKDLIEILKKINSKNLEFNNEFEKKLNNDIKNRDNNTLTENNVEIKDKEINFELWNKLTSDLKLKTFLNKVFIKGKNDEKAFFNENIFENIIDDENENFKEFIKEEFEKKYGESFSSYNMSKYNKYKNEVFIQFKVAKSNFEKIKNINELYNYVEDNLNDFQLIITWFHFLLRKEHSLKTNELMENLKMDSSVFTEKVISNLQNKGLISIGEDGKIEGDLKGKLRIGTSDSYNTTTWNLENVENLYKRTANGKPADLNNNFSIKEGGIKKYFKNIHGLYVPEGVDKDNDNLDEVATYVDSGLSLVRKIISGEKIVESNLSESEKKYLDFLNKIEFSIQKEKYLKKLLEFLKFIKKETFGIISEQHENSIEDTKFIKTNFKENDEFINKLFEGTSGNSDDILIGGTKSIIGGYIKGVSKYGGNFEKIGDKTRMTILGNNDDELATITANFIEQVNNIPEVVRINLEDKIGNILKKAKRENGYRDAKITLDLENGNSVEVQFQLKDYFKVKHDGIKIGEELENKLNPDDSKIYFNDEEKKQIIDFYKNTNEKIPRDFAKLFLGLSNEDFNKKEYKNIFSDDVKFSADFTYRAERAIGVKSIIDKLKEIDKRLFDVIAGGKAARKHIERIMGDKEFGK